MAEGNSILKPDAGGGWPFTHLPFAASSFPGQAHLAEQTARVSMMGLEMMESWLAASRQSLDLWRTSVRQMQDGMLASYRKQVIDNLSHDLVDQSDTHPPGAAKRQPLTQTAVAKADTAKAA